LFSAKNNTPTLREEYDANYFYHIKRGCP